MCDAIWMLTFSIYRREQSASGAESSLAVSIDAANAAKARLPPMFNPILGELVARERFKDFIREAEQNQLANAVLARQPAHRFELTAALSDLLLTVRHLFKGLAHAD